MAWPGAALLTAAAVALALARRRRGRVRLGVVCMTKQPLDFFAWLRHHRRTGVEHFFVRVEDTPELARALQRPPYDRFVTCEVGSGEREYYRQVDRQQDFVRRAICAARQLGVSHLVHIDDDELLHCPAGRGALDDEMLAAAGASCFVLQNVEAVFDEERCERVFEGTTAFCTNPVKFTAYVNGKSIGATEDAALAPRGAHRFTGAEHHVPSRVALVLHYESPCVARWRQKFRAYAERNASACASGDLPFPFYCESMRPDASEATWRAWKTRARHARADLVDVTI